MVVVSLNKQASREFKELKKMIAERLGVDESMISASFVIHYLYKAYTSGKIKADV